jgi:hypothetical protein
VSVTPADLERWFGAEPPVLYYPSFGRQASGPQLRRDDEGEEPIRTSSRADPRLEWEHERDQDLSVVVTDAVLYGWDDERSAAVNQRFHVALNRSAPNPMESALRSITWLELVRFRGMDPTFSHEQKRRLASWLIRCGGDIEQRLHEIPLGGNHLLTHAAGLLYIGRLLPGSSRTARWARRGERLLHTEVLRQFYIDGGTYEQSLPYHLFALDVVLGCALLLRGQGVELPAPVAERIRAAAQFAGTIARPDGTIPILGDDDSGRFHRWGNQPAVRELCSLAALMLDDAELAVAAAGTSTAAAWLTGSDATARLNALALSHGGPVASRSFVRSGLHVLRSPGVHVAVWSRDPSPPAMLAHGHSDHNSIDVWCCGAHVLRDPGTGIYVGDTALRNRLRATEAHSTLAIDGREITPFDPGDVFFMPPSTRGRRVEWSQSSHDQSVTTTHDGFRRLRSRPLHLRCVALNIATDELTVWDEVGGTAHDLSYRLVQGWWHWGAEPSDAVRDEYDRVARWRFRISGVNVELHLPIDAEFVMSQSFPWSPRYGVIESGRRSVVQYRGPLPFRMALRLYRDE